jgi:hypothetical protein
MSALFEQVGYFAGKAFFLLLLRALTAELSSYFWQRLIFDHQILLPQVQGQLPLLLGFETQTEVDKHGTGQNIALESQDKVH